MKRAGAMLAICILLLAAMALKGALITLPTSSATGFNADRAAQRLARILGDQKPHPVDSANGDSVRGRLAAEMRRVGLHPRESDDFACNSFARNRSVSCARVRNLVATIGPSEGRHLLLVAHHDSTFAGPGASDDGIGVASLLEIAANLRGRALARPVTFLIDDGEEAGLLGARAFLERDPLAGQVGTLVNLEARGVTGPAIMFETSHPNGPAIALYRAVDRPAANSLSTDLYRLIPNSTDVAVFEARPWTILNFAVIGNETRYHSAGDTLAALDHRSLQHMGDQALAVALRAGSEPVPAASGERVYMDLLGRTQIALPLGLGLVLAGALLVFFLIEAWRRGAVGMPLLAMAAALAGSAALAFAGHFIVQLLRPGDYWRAYPLVTTTAVYASALAACVAALLVVARTRERTRLRPAFWVALQLAGAAICIVAPGAAIYFLLPPAAAALGMAGKRWFAGAEQAGAALAILLLYLTFGPFLASFEELMNGGPLWAFAPLAAAILLPALIELRPLLAGIRLPAALALLGWIGAGLTPAYSAERQQLLTIEYVRDQDGSARFAINNDGAPVPFAAPWRRTEMPYTTRRRWAAPAPAVAIPAPLVTLIAQQPLGAGRRLRFRIAANGAESVSMIAPAAARLVGGGAPGFLRRFGHGGAKDHYYLRCTGRACDGAVLDLIAGDRGPIDLTIIGSRSGLPPVAATLVRARPALARPQYGPDATITVGHIRL